MAEAIGYSILGRIGENLVDPIGRQFRCLFCFNNNIQNLQTQLDKVKLSRDGVQLWVDQEHNNERTVEPQVEAWLDDAEKKTTEAEATIIECETKVEKGCLKGWCFCRYSLSKKAVNKTRDLENLLTDHSNLTLSSYSPPPPCRNPIPTTEFMELDSRRLIMDEIIENLENDEINLIGICGMGGIGKTTMVKEVANKIRENNKFHEISFVVVQQQPDMIQIQKDIAKTLDLKLEQDNLAHLLRQRLSAGKDNKRILLILDDVWEQFNLNDVGIPLVSGGSGCKILYTSRNRELWNDVRTKREIHIGLLREEEAWQLFRDKVGDSVDDPKLQPIAKQIVNKCEGLPLALVVVGSMLNNDIEHKGEDMLLRLQMPQSTSNPSGGVDELVEALKLGYLLFQ